MRADDLLRVRMIYYACRFSVKRADILLRVPILIWPIAK